jgi:tRNA(adenine34) deaminase
MQVRPADAEAMRLALQEARAAGEDIPIGAVVVDQGGNLLARDRNRREETQDPTAHAEILVLRRAAEIRGSWRLAGCTLAVTIEPCPMCAGAAALARVDRVVFGAWNEEYGACGSRWDILRDRRLPHRPEVVAGVLATECGSLVQEFLSERRPQEGSWQG